MAECTIEVTAYAGEVRCTMAFPDGGPVVTRTLGRRGFESQEATTNRVMGLCTSAGIEELERRREFDLNASRNIAGDGRIWRAGAYGRADGQSPQSAQTNDALKPPPGSSHHDRCDNGRAMKDAARR
jgi:hypothetical protein